MGTSIYVTQYELEGTESSSCADRCVPTAYRLAGIIAASADEAANDTALRLRRCDEASGSTEYLTRRREGLQHLRAEDIVSAGGGYERVCVCYSIAAIVAATADYTAELEVEDAASYCAEDSMMQSSCR